MGALQGGRCFLSSSDALDAYYLAAPVQIVSGSTSYATRFEKVAGTWKSIGYSISGTGTWTQRYTTNAPVPTFPYCDEIEGLKDGIAIGWLIATAVIAAAAMMMMKRGAR